MPGTPTLLSVTPTASAKLVWTSVSDVTHYSISYGPSSGNYLYGVVNTGNVTEFVVGGLDPGIDYCFAVRAVNDCAPGSLSNEICLGEARGRVLGATTLAKTGSLDWQELLWLNKADFGHGLDLLSGSFQLAKTITDQLPTRIIVPQVKIDLAIEASDIFGGEWQISREGASYLRSSALPGKKGNLIVYGHNRRHLLGRLRWINEGETVLIQNKAGEVFGYQIESIKQVSPDEVEILLPTDDQTLTLYTCAGWGDSQRLVVTAKLQSAG